jgi:hypothetical protein
MKIGVCVVFLSATLWACFARADEAERLSDRDRLLIAGQVSGHWQNKQRREIAVDPSLSWFFADRASAGAYFAYRVRDENYDVSWRTWELGVQSVEELPLSDALGLFFLFKVGYAHVERSLFGPYDYPSLFPTHSNNLTTFEPYPRVGEHALHFEVSLPLTYHVNSRVGVGLGPQFAADWFVSPNFANFRVGLASWLAISI